MVTHNDSNVSELKKKLKDSKQEESPFTFDSQIKLDTRLLEILNEIKNNFPDSNLKIQSELASEDEIHYFYSHCEIQIDTGSMLDSSNLISHLATHFQYLIDFYDSKIIFNGVPEVKRNRKLLRTQLDELLILLEAIKSRIPSCDF